MVPRLQKQESQVLEQAVKRKLCASFLPPVLEGIEVFAYESMYTESLRQEKAACLADHGWKDNYFEK